MISNKVIWSEGMFLQPQHLQQQERYFEHLIRNQTITIDTSNWGVLEYQIDQELLSLGKFGLTTCKGIFPDGTFFNTFTEGYTPPPIDIPIELTNHYIYLALPLKRTGLAEVGFNAEHEFSCRYLSQSIEVSDAIIDSNVSTEIQIGKLWLRFMHEGEELGGYNSLPIARIKEVLPTKQVILDENFLPPNLNVYAISKLNNFLKELSSLLYNRGETLANAQTELGTGGTSEIVDFLLLGIINRAEAILQFYTNKNGWHPEGLYLYLTELLANLAIFSNKSRRIQPLPCYTHHDLQHSFEPLILEVRKALSSLMLHSALELELTSKGFGIWSAPLNDKNLLKNTDFILGVHAELPNHLLCEQVASQVKVASMEMIDKLITHALIGIELEPLTTPPREIPLNLGYTYFSLNKNNDLWKDLATTASIAIHFGSEFPGLKLQLWAVRNAKNG